MAVIAFWVMWMGSRGHFVVIGWLLAWTSNAADLVSTDFTGTSSAKGSISEFFVISADGRFAAFSSVATNHVRHDTNGVQDVFVHDCVLRRHVWDTTHAEVRITPGAFSGSTARALSADGRYFVFSSTATSLVTGVTVSGSQLYVQDLVSNVTTLASMAHDGSAGASPSGVGSSTISGDGRIVAFVSYATNLVTVRDANAGPDLFTRDLATEATELITTSPDGTSTQDGYLTSFVMSTNGRYFAFETTASNVLAGITKTNRTSQVYWRDRVAGTTRLVSQTVDGGFAEGYANLRDMSRDGRFVCFWSIATNLVPDQNDRNGTADVFIRDMLLGETWLVTRNTNGVTTASRNSGGRFSANGEWLLFSATVADLVPGIADANSGSSDVFAHYLPERTNAIVSVSAGGSTGADYHASDGFARISASGRFVLFTSLATNLMPGTTGRVQRLFLRDLEAGRTLNPLRASSFPTPPLNEMRLAIADTERHFFFESLANFDPSVTDTNNGLDLFRAALYEPKFLNSGAPGTPLHADGLTGFSYILETSSNLVHWTAIETNVAGAQGRFTVQDPQPAASSLRFYRLLWE